MKYNTLAEQIYMVATDDSLWKRKEAWLNECEGMHVVELWKILFETDIEDVELLEERIFSFGSRIKEQDLWGREIFVCLVAFLNLVIK